MPGLFDGRPRKGSRWLKDLDPDDRKAFSDLGLHHLFARFPGTRWQSSGGRARAAQAGRDARGRFIRVGEDPGEAPGRPPEGQGGPRPGEGGESTSPEEWPPF